MQREAQSLRNEARSARSDQRKGAGAHDMEARAERLEAEAQERATTTDTALPYADEEAPMILGEVTEGTHEDPEPTFADRVTWAVHERGGDPNDVHERAMAEIRPSTQATRSDELRPVARVNQSIAPGAP